MRECSFCGGRRRLVWVDGFGCGGGGGWPPTAHRFCVVDMAVVSLVDRVGTSKRMYFGSFLVAQAPCVAAKYVGVNLVGCCFGMDRGSIVYAATVSRARMLSMYQVRYISMNA